MRIILGAIIIVLGALLVLKSEKVYNSFGSIAFFDKHFGTEGGGRLGYPLIGMFIVFIGVLVLTNMIGGFVLWVLSPIVDLRGGF